MKKIFIAFGTRPEIIKLSPVIRELKKYKKEICTVICNTAQHRFMSDQFIRLFHMQVDYDLDIMSESQKLSTLTSKLLLSIGNILKKEKPDIVLIQGDTTTAFATALSSYYQKIPIGHIEAGLRTHNKYEPFPEELNRKFISSMADIHFAPTKLAMENLIAEGISQDIIHTTGNTIVDAVQFLLKKENSISLNKKSILITVHRRENIGKPLSNVCNALKKIVQEHPNIIIFFPVHPNPEVKNFVYATLKNIKNVKLILPLPYKKFISLLSKSNLILTDSGGVQEEGVSLGKKVFVLRNITERPEGVETGLLEIVGTDTNNIFKKADIFFKTDFNERKKYNNPYGDGKASERIIKILQNYIL